MFTFSSLPKAGRAERRKCLKLMEYTIFLLRGRHQSSGAKLTDEDGSAKLRLAGYDLHHQLVHRGTTRQGRAEPRRGQRPSGGSAPVIGKLGFLLWVLGLVNKIISDRLRGKHVGYFIGV